MRFFTTTTMGDDISEHTNKNIMEYTRELHNPIKILLLADTESHSRFEFLTLAR